MTSTRSVFKVLVILALAVTTFLAVASAEDKTPLKQVTVLLSADSSMTPKFVKECAQLAPERGLAFTFTADKSDAWDVHVVLSTEGASAWTWAHGSAVILDRNNDVMFTVNRSDRLTPK